MTFALGAFPGLTQQAQPVLVQGSLTAAGSAPFHLKAEITEGNEPSPVAEVEVEWLAPDKWRRSIKSDEFTQTYIVDGHKRSDQHSDTYFPIGFQTLITAMTNPSAILAAYEPGGRQLTKANGASTEAGLVCYDEKRTLCLRSRYGLMESIEVPGQSIDLMQYERFGDKRIARRIVHMVSVGDFETARITELKEIKHPDPGSIAIGTVTPAADQIHVSPFKESELRSLAISEMEVIWPQVLDGAETGQATFYLGIDPRGKVREVLPIRTANERSNDSAIRQIMRWKFKPPIRDGLPVQAEGMLTLPLNTRAFGPSEVLKDTDARKLATNIVEPVLPPGTVLPGTEYKLWIAVDSDGVVIEKIVSSGPGNIFGYVDAALKQWHFSPIVQNGKAMPWRGLLVFKF